MKSIVHHKFLLIRVLGAALLSASASSSTGCSAEPGSEAEPVARGSVNLPLLTTVNGSTYRLSGATIELRGPVYPYYVYLSGSDDPSETALSTTLATGTYEASLFSSWTLQKLATDGTFQPVRATLRSSPYAVVAVFNGTTSTLSYEFETDGVIVTVGQGDLDVVIDVDEIAAACTPLGSSCGEGLWCPPPDLTGAPLACHAAGSVAIGGDCHDTSSCVANAACFDLGSGSVCAALCGALDIGLPCASGGVCQAAGGSYGICR